MFLIYKIFHLYYLLYSLSTDIKKILSPHNKSILEVNINSEIIYCNFPKMKMPKTKHK